VQQISRREILLGDQDQNMLARKLLGANNFAEEACYLSKEKGSDGTGKVELKGVPCFYPPVGL
jgi:hypothetical protein